MGAERTAPRYPDRKSGASGSAIQERLTWADATRCDPTRPEGLPVPERRVGSHPVLLEGAVDMHVHFGPEASIELLSGSTHSVDPIEAARDAAELGMAALVLKPHEFASTTAAYLASKVVDTITVLAGMCCDYPMGGLNPIAVETALNSGARVIWLPTVSSRHGGDEILRLLYGQASGIEVIDEEGEVVEPVRQIMDLVSEHSAVLATGHISTSEHFAVANAFAQRGRLVVTHAMQEGAGPRLSKSDCVELADLGAVIELTASTCMGTPASLAQVADAVRMVGPGRVVMSTDYGWSTAIPKPAAGLQSYVDALWAEGVSEADLRQMACVNPARILQLS